MNNTEIEQLKADIKTLKEDATMFTPVPGLPTIAECIAGMEKKILLIESAQKK